MIESSNATGVSEPARVEYRTIPWAEGYRFGSDGSAWTSWRRGGGPIRTADDTAWRRMIPTVRGDGYLAIKLRTGRQGGKLHLLHVLVCEAFHGPKPDGMEVLHDPDRDPANCRSDNLRWGTSAENKADMERHGTRPKGERNGRAKLTEEDIPAIRRLYAGPDCPKDIAAMYGVDPKLIRKIGQGKLWRHVPYDN